MFEERVKAVIFKVAMFWLHTRKNKLEKWLKKNKSRLQMELRFYSLETIPHAEKEPGILSI